MSILLVAVLSVSGEGSGESRAMEGILKNSGGIMCWKEVVFSPVAGPDVEVVVMQVELTVEKAGGERIAEGATKLTDSDTVLVNVAKALSAGGLLVCEVTIGDRDIMEDL